MKYFYESSFVTEDPRKEYKEEIVVFSSDKIEGTKTIANFEMNLKNLESLKVLLEYINSNELTLI